MSKVIKGLKLIRHNARGVNEPDDPSYPFLMSMKCRPPEFMKMAFIGLCGPTEDILVRGDTRRAIDEFVKLNKLKTHPRLIELTIECDLKSMKDVMKDKAQWEDFFNLVIIDPDGWRRDDLSFNWPLTIKEFVDRASASTCELSRFFVEAAREIESWK